MGRADLGEVQDVTIIGPNCAEGGVGEIGASPQRRPGPLQAHAAEGKAGVVAAEIPDRDLADHARRKEWNNLRSLDMKGRKLIGGAPQIH